MRETIITVLVGLTMLLGLLGIVIPVLPDLLLIWIGALAYGLLIGWGSIGPWLFALITLIGVIGALAEGWTTGAGARAGGASWQSVLVGLVLGVLGFIVLFPWGFLVGFLVGTFLVELWRHRKLDHAAKAVAGTGLGYGASFVVKFSFGVVMIGVWLVWVVAG